MEIKKTVQTLFTNSAQNMKKMAENEAVLKSMEVAVTQIIEAYKNGGCLFTAGNGGSAADAQHFATELVVKLGPNRTAIKAFALTTDSSALTAIGNDFGFDHVFSRQIDANMSSKDIFFAITTSGQSPNILEALKMCRKKKIKSILLTGRDGGRAVAEGLADLAIFAPGETTNMIQECHLLIEHTFSTLIEKGLNEAGLVKYL